MNHETENCVICNVDTNVPKTIDIQYRLFYVEGSGQLCRECWNSTYNDNVEEPEPFLQTR